MTTRFLGSENRMCQAAPVHKLQTFNHGKSSHKSSEWLTRNDDPKDY